MSDDDEREVRQEVSFWGTEKEVVYVDGKPVGEIKSEERGGFLGLGAETVKVEYRNGQEVGYTKSEERGGFLGVGAREERVTYNTSHEEIEHSRVEERGGFLGLGSHHVRVGYDSEGNEVSQTNHERRGGFLGFAGESVRVTRSTGPRGSRNGSSTTSDFPVTHRSSASGRRATGGSILGKLVGIAIIVVLLVWFVPWVAKLVRDRNSGANVRVVRGSEPPGRRAVATLIVDAELYGEGSWWHDTGFIFDMEAGGHKHVCSPGAARTPCTYTIRPSPILTGLDVHVKVAEHSLFSSPYVDRTYVLSSVPDQINDVFERDGVRVTIALSVSGPPEEPVTDVKPPPANKGKRGRKSR